MNNSPNSLKIDLSALTHNLRQVKDLTGAGVAIMGVVKSDAYGHGMLPVSRILEKNGIHCLGVAHVYEGIELREKGIRLPVVILCGIQTEEEARHVVEKDLTPVLFDLAIAEVLDLESARQGKKTSIHLKIDTGMGRLGIFHNEIGPFLQKAMSLKNLNLEALTSHLSSADQQADDFTDLQTMLFEKAVEAGRSMGLPLPFNNLANSAGVMHHKKTHFEMVRPGIMLYGGLPSPEFVSPVPMKPVMHFKGRILQTRDLPDRTPVSYGRAYLTNGPHRMAIISAGYGDGLPRSMSNIGKVLIRGREAPIVGTICMNLTICDISGQNDIRPGDEVFFLGSQGPKIITGDDIARWANTISYEVFCSIGRQHRKVYV